MKELLKIKKLNTRARTCYIAGVTSFSINNYLDILNTIF